jgi:hypothetical protein
MGEIMYALANVDFSHRFGVVISELPPDEIDREGQTLDAKQGADLATASLAARELQMAVFGAP